MRAPSGRKILAIEIYWWHNDARIDSLHIRKELMDIKGTPTVMQTCTSYSFFIFSAEHRIPVVMCSHTYTTYNVCHCIAIHSHQCWQCYSPLFLVFYPDYSIHQNIEQGVCLDHTCHAARMTEWVWVISTHGDV